MSGLFITFEGGEGCGKSTQISLLKEYLEEQGKTAMETREPGGTPIAEAIREVLLNPEHKAMCTEAELLLYAAARAQHIHEKVQPALASGSIVLCDRFADSTTAYQGAARGVVPDILHTLNQIATAGLMPHKTILIDLDPVVGLDRARIRGKADRLESEQLDFHQAVRAGFLSIAKAEPERVLVIDGAQEIKAIALEIQSAVEGLL